MAVASIANDWQELLSEGGERVVHVTQEQSREPRFEPFPHDLDPRLQSALIAEGVTALYAHQAAVWRLARAGRDVCIVTGTASGKSLAFNLPVLETLIEEPGSRALYIYPSKALAQDQARALAALRLRLRPIVYDGDTDRARRAIARRHGNPILTNPDMLHVGILPNHSRWAEVLARLRYVVVDEAHAYRGVFGSHVGCVLRRLRRLCALYGAAPQFLLASATVANPAQAAALLTGLDVDVVADDAAPRPARTIAFWTPAVLDEASGETASTLGEAARLLVSLVESGSRTLCFVKTRKASELVFRFARDGLIARGREDLAGRLSPYRAGYTAEVRRAIESDLVSGKLVGVVATDALELGIDIGLLDCAISVGFPGTVASLRQQWGRAGRRGDGLAVFVPSDDALDQFFVRHPEALLERSVEAVMLDPSSRDIRLGHLRAAAHEHPLAPCDEATLGEGTLQAAEPLVASGELLATPAGLAWRGPDSPAGRVSLRSSSTGQVVVVEESTGTLLGQLEEERAAAAVHVGAVYLHRGDAYLVHDLDLEAGLALVEPFAGGWYTQPRRHTETRILDVVVAPTKRAGVALSLGEVEVTDHVVGYQRRSLPGHAIVDSRPLELPERRFRTVALWFEPAPRLLAGVGGSALGALHAAEHTLISVLPLYAMCDRWDIGGLSTDVHPQTGGPTVFIYDGHPGGVGLSRRGHERFEELVADAARIIAECPCESGCPSCVQSPKCGNLNDMLDKGAAGRLLGTMTARSAAT